MRSTSARAAFAAASIFCVITCADAAFISGDIIRLGDVPGGPGGLFDVTKPGDPSVAFQTFCSHVYEDLDFDTNYKAVISDVTDPDDLPVGPQAAWLYTQFLKQDEGELPGFLFNRITPAWNFNTTANNQARALQLGIWLGMGFSENEIQFNTSWDDDYIDDLRDDYLDAWLVNYVASGWGQNNFTGRIKILNLYGYSNTTGDYTRNVQDQLIEVPEPGVAFVVGTLLVGAALGRVWMHSRGDAHC